MIGLFLTFLSVLFILSFLSYKKVKTTSDFLIAGRQFNLWLVTFSLFATWFGAGTLLTASDEISVVGLSAISLEPLGAGLCLIFASIFSAKKLWNLNIMTVADLYRIKFGKVLEKLAVFASVPSFVGWIAVQIVALANIIHLFLPLPLWQIMLFIVVTSTLLTLMGGLWSVTITDSLQLVIIIIGVSTLFIHIVFEFDILALWTNLAPAKKVVIPTENGHELLGWVSTLLVSSFGNITGQDLTQRIFCAKSAKVAQMGALLAGVMYIVVGAMPVMIALFASELIPQIQSTNVLTLMAYKFLPSSLYMIFLLSLFSTIFSTITSALLAPASMISHNLLKQYFTDKELVLSRLSVVFIAVLSFITALLGEDVYSLLESSYAIGLVCFFIPFMFALYAKKHNEKAIIVSLFISLVIWLSSFFINNFEYAELVSVLCMFLSYLILSKIFLNKNA